MQLSYKVIVSSALVAFLSFAIGIRQFDGWLNNNFSCWRCLSCLIQAFGLYVLSELVRVVRESLSVMKA